MRSKSALRGLMSTTLCLLLVFTMPLLHPRSIADAAAYGPVEFWWYAKATPTIAQCRAGCALRPGGFLATIMSLSENMKAYAAMPTSAANAGMIGGNRLTDANNFRWTEGPEGQFNGGLGMLIWNSKTTSGTCKAPYCNFYSGEPNNYGTTPGEPIMYMYGNSNGASRRMWNDDQLTTTTAAGCICKRVFSRSGSRSSTTSYSKEVTSSRSRSSAASPSVSPSYSINVGKAILTFWFVAHAGASQSACTTACAVNGGHPAVLTSAGENALMLRALPASVTAVLLGATRTTGDGTKYRWVSGPLGQRNSGVGAPLYDIVGLQCVLHCNFDAGQPAATAGKDQLLMRGPSAAPPGVAGLWFDDAATVADGCGCMNTTFHTFTHPRTPTTSVSCSLSQTASLSAPLTQSRTLLGTQSSTRTRSPVPLEYWFHAAHAPSVSDCRSMCARRAGGVVATLSTALQNELARQTLPTGVKLAMLGGNRLTDPNNFRWTEGPLGAANGGLGTLVWSGITTSGSCAAGGYCNFAPGQPNNANAGEPILYLLGPSFTLAPGTWIDAPDSESLCDGCTCMRFNTYSIALSPSRSQERTSSPTSSSSYSMSSSNPSRSASTSAAETLSTSRSHSQSPSWTHSLTATPAFSRSIYSMTTSNTVSPSSTLRESPTLGSLSLSTAASATVSTSPSATPDASRSVSMSMSTSLSPAATQTKPTASDESTISPSSSLLPTATLARDSETRSASWSASSTNDETSSSTQSMSTSPTRSSSWPATATESLSRRSPSAPASATPSTTATATLGASRSWTSTLSGSHTRGTQSASHATSSTDTLRPTRTPTASVTASSTATADPTTTPSSTATASLSHTISPIGSRSMSNPSSTASPSWSVLASSSVSMSVSRTASKSSSAEVSPSASTSPTTDATPSLASWSMYPSATRTPTASFSSSERISATVGSATAPASDSYSTSASATATMTAGHPSRSNSASASKSASASHVALTATASASNLASVSFSLSRSLSTTRTDEEFSRTVEPTATYPISSSETERTPSITNSSVRSPSATPSTSLQVTSTRSVGSRSSTVVESSSASLVHTPSPTLGYPSVTFSATRWRSQTSSPSPSSTRTTSRSVTPSLSLTTSVSRTPSVTFRLSASKTVSRTTSRSASSTASLTVSTTGSPSASVSHSVTLSSSVSHSRSRSPPTHSSAPTVSASCSPSHVISATGATPTFMDVQPFPFIVLQRRGEGVAHWAGDGVPVVTASNDTHATMDLFAVSIDGAAPPLSYRGMINVSVASASNDVVVLTSYALEFPDAIDVVLPCRVVVAISSVSPRRCAWAASEVLWVTVTYPFLNASHTLAVRVQLDPLLTVPLGNGTSLDELVSATCPVLLSPQTAVATAVPQQLDFGISRIAAYGLPTYVHASSAPSGRIGALIDGAAGLLTTLPDGRFNGYATFPVVYVASSASSFDATTTVHLGAHLSMNAAALSLSPRYVSVAATTTVRVVMCSMCIAVDAVPAQLLLRTNATPHDVVRVAQLPVTAAVGSDQWLCAVYYKQGTGNVRLFHGAVAAQRIDPCTLECNLTWLAAIGSNASTADVSIISVGSPTVQRRVASVWLFPFPSGGGWHVVASPRAVVRGVHIQPVDSPSILVMRADVLPVSAWLVPELRVTIALVSPAGTGQSVPAAALGLRMTIVTLSSNRTDGAFALIAAMLPIQCATTSEGFLVPSFLPLDFLNGTAAAFQFTASIVPAVGAAGNETPVVVAFEVHVGTAAPSCATQPEPVAWGEEAPNHAVMDWYVAGCSLDVFPVTAACNGKERIAVSAAALPAHATSSTVAVIVLFTDDGGQRLSLLCHDLVVVVDTAPDAPRPGDAATGVVVAWCTLPSIATSAAVDVRIVNVSTGSVLADLVGAATFTDISSSSGAGVPEDVCSTDVPGTVCSGHGTCDRVRRSCKCHADEANGYWAGTACSSCAVGFYGADCTSRCPGAGCAVCSGHGMCDDGRSGTGLCACVQSPTSGGFWVAPSCDDCSPGYFGDGCVAVCPQDPTTGMTCGGGTRGQCDQGVAGSGACICNRGFAGTSCTLCAPGFFGAACAACPSATSEPCSGRGACSDGSLGNGTCTCTIGAGGSACNLQCPVAFGATCGWGQCVSAQNCSCTWPVVRAPTDGTCSSCAHGRWGVRCLGVCNCTHGRCDPVTGLCVCDGGYWGPSCSDACPGGAATPCTGHGTCDAATGACSCYVSVHQGYYAGATCAECHPSYMSTDCNVACPTDANGVVCSGRGRCFNGSCEGACFSGYWGSVCQNVCPGGAAHPCSGNGLCDETTGMCVCQYGAVGNACQLACPGFGTTASPCNDHGICTPTGACQCHSDADNGFWSGAACDVCASPFSGPRCINVCNPSTGRVVAGVCVCASGYVGEQCALECPTDDLGRVCSAAGTCVWNATADTAECLCATNHYGSHCGVWCTPDHCQHTDGLLRAQCNPSSGACECQFTAAGRFQGDRCDVCADGFWGAECNAECPCSGRGTCDRFTPTCHCTSGFGSGHWDGASCDACAKGYIGVLCDQQNIELSDVQASTLGLDNDGFPRDGIAFHDPGTNVLIIGSAPIAVFQTESWTTRLEFLQVLALPSPAIDCHIANDTHLVLRLLPSDVASHIPLVVLNRRALASGAHPLLVATTTTQRVAQSLSTADTAFTIATDPQTGCAAFFVALAPVVTVVCGLQQHAWRCSGGAVHWMGFVGPLLIFTCQDPVTERAWRMVAVDMPSFAVVFNVSSADVPLVACESRGGCNRASHCVLASLDGSTLVCAANTDLDTRNALVFFTIDAATGLLANLHGPPVVVPEASKVSAATADSDFLNGIFAFEGPTTAALCRIQFQPLALVTLYTLERANGDRPQVLSMTLNATTRTLWLSVATAQVVRAVALNLFSVRVVEPRVFDQLGGTTVTVRGFGFVRDPTPLCDFDSGLTSLVPSVSSSRATFVDSTTLLCTATAVPVLDASCATLHLNVWYGGRATRTTLAGTLRPLTPTLDAASTVESGGRAAAFHAAATVVTLSGFGFATGASLASCRIDSGATRTTCNATALGTTAALCYVPAGLTPTIPGSVIRYAHDGFVYSASAAVFAIVGDYASIRATSDTGAALAAAVQTLLPVVIVETTDRAGNVLGRFDNESRDIRCSTVDPLLLAAADAPQPAFASGSTLAAASVRGSASFANTSLNAPAATAAMTIYYFVALDLTTSASIVFVVVPGAPARLALATSASVASWASGVEEATTLPSFAIVVVDRVGNAVTNITALPNPVTLRYTNVLPPTAVDGMPARDDAAGLRSVPVTMLATLDLSSSSFTFEGVVVRSPFGTPVVLHFVCADASIAQLSSTLPQQRCDARSYGVTDAFRCSLCPAHATCDGSTTVVADKGYWRGRITSVHLYPCEPSESCHTSTECEAAYDGPLCGSCAEGYGRSLASCTPCTSKTTPWVLVAVIVVAVVVAVWLLALRTIAFTSTADVAARLVSVSETRSTLSIVAKVALSHVQTLSLLPLRLLAVSWIADALSNSGSWSVVTPGFLNVACAIGRRAADEMRASVWLLGAGLAGCLLVAAFLALLADAHFSAAAKRTVARIRARCAKAIHASPTHFEAADRALTEANFPRNVQQMTVLANHKQLLEEYPGDVQLDPDDPVSWFGVGDGDAPIPLEDLVAKCCEADGEPLPHVVPRPPLWTRMLNVWLVSTVVLTFLLYPTIVQAAVRVLHCRRILLGDGPEDSISVLAYDPVVDCSHPTFAGMRAEASIVLALVGLGVPILCPLLVVVARVLTCSGSMERALQLFYFVSGGYRVWYWESIVLARKACMVVAVVLVDDDQVASMVCFWVVGVALALNILLEPWLDKRLQLLEASSLGSLTLTSLCLAILSRLQNDDGPFPLVLVCVVAVTNVTAAVVIVRGFSAALVAAASEVPIIREALDDPTNRIESLRSDVLAVRDHCAAAHHRLAALMACLDDVAAACPSLLSTAGRSDLVTTSSSIGSLCPHSDDDVHQPTTTAMPDEQPSLLRSITLSAMTSLESDNAADGVSLMDGLCSDAPMDPWSGHGWMRHNTGDRKRSAPNDDYQKPLSAAASLAWDTLEGFAPIEMHYGGISYDDGDDASVDGAVATTVDFMPSTQPSRPTTQMTLRRHHTGGQRPSRTIPDVFFDDIDVPDLHQTFSWVGLRSCIDDVNPSMVEMRHPAFCMDDEISVGSIDVGDLPELPASPRTHMRMPAALVGSSKGMHTDEDRRHWSTRPDDCSFRAGRRTATEEVCDKDALSKGIAALRTAHTMVPRQVLAIEADIVSCGTGVGGGGTASALSRLVGHAQQRRLEVKEQHSLMELYDAEEHMMRILYAAICRMHC